MPVAGQSALVVGLDIGATKTIAGLVTKDGDLLRSLQVATAPSPPAILRAARALCESLIAEAEAPVLGIGIGCAGVVDTRRARVIHANDNLPGWGGTELSALATGGLPIVAETMSAPWPMARRRWAPAAATTRCSALPSAQASAARSSSRAKFGRARTSAPARSVIWWSAGMMESR